MNNARQTVNESLQSITAGIADFGFYTGDEENATITPPAVSILWLDGDGYSALKSDFRMRLAQIDVITTAQDTTGAELACEAILAGFGIQRGARPLGIIPLQSWALVGVTPTGTPTGSNIVLRLQLGKGWKRLDPPQQRARRYMLTLEVHYLP